jgi:hypothetical protein
MLKNFEDYELSAEDIEMFNTDEMEQKAKEYSDINTLFLSNKKELVNILNNTQDMKNTKLYKPIVKRYAHLKSYDKKINSGKLWGFVKNSTRFIKFFNLGDLYNSIEEYDATMNRKIKDACHEYNILLLNFEGLFEYYEECVQEQKKPIAIAWDI